MTAKLTRDVLDNAFREEVAISIKGNVYRPGVSPDGFWALVADNGNHIKTHQCVSTPGYKEYDLFDGAYSLYVLDKMATISRIVGGIKPSAVKHYIPKHDPQWLGKML